jgi:DNA-binding CsgD family transcriptional regulator
MDLSEIIPEIYDAATDNSRWHGLMDRIANLINANVSALIFQDIRTGVGDAIYSRVDAEIFQQYFSRFSESNVLLRHANTLRTGDVSFEREIAPIDELRGSEYYNEFLLPYGMAQVVALTVWREPQRIGILNFTRRENDEIFGVREKALCQELMPHLQRAFVISSRLQELQGIAQDGLAALQKLSWGAILVDCDRRISFANGVAEQILQRGDGLRAHLGLLYARSPADNAALARAIQSALRGEGAALTVSRTDTAASYVLVVAPLGARQGWLGLRRPAFLVVVTDPERPPNVDTNRLKAIYGLTTTEAALAARLAIGADLAKIGRQLGIKHETARTHLKHVFLKLGVSKQGELISKVIREAMLFSL